MKICALNGAELSQISELNYKIRVKTLEGQILTFTNVSEYSADEGLIHFKDSKTARNLTFSASAVEIEPMGAKR